MQITKEQAIASGVERATSLSKAHGINSPQVLNCLVRWASIIGDLPTKAGA